MRRTIAFLILIHGFAVLPAVAGSGEYFRLARISYLEGHVGFQHAGAVEWSAASVNMALQPSDRIYTGDYGRAEVEFDDGSVLWLAENTDLEILSLRDGIIELRLLLGLCTLNAQSAVTFVVDTPGASFNTVRKGVYRFDVAENGASDGIVRKGLLNASGAGFSQRVESGELLHATAGQGATQARARYERRDGWDEWTDRRTADLVAYESRRYVPDYVYIGVRDLDRYGRWTVVASYGSVWIPYNVGPHWSPYWEGRWYYRPHWGWTWVSYEPWGWLPYHYGRWHHGPGIGWYWIPGASFGFHFWSPGLVRFYRGPNWLSWCPLGPGDYYNVNNYYYHSTYNYHLTNIRLQQRRGPEDLINRDVPGAFRTTRTEDFVSNSLGRGRVQELDENQPWQRGRVVTGDLEIQPNARSYAPAPDRPGSRPGENGGLAARSERLSNPTERGVQADRSGSAVTVPGGRSLGRTPAESTAGQGRNLEETDRARRGVSLQRSAEPSANQRDVGNARTIWQRRPDRTEPAGNEARSLPQGSTEGRSLRTEPPTGRGTTMIERSAPARSAPGRQRIEREPTPQRQANPAPAPRVERAPSVQRETAPNPASRSARPVPERTPQIERPRPEARPEVERIRPESRPRPVDPPDFASSSRATQIDRQSGLGNSRTGLSGRTAVPQSRQVFGSSVNRAGTMAREPDGSSRVRAPAATGGLNNTRRTAPSMGTEPGSQARGNGPSIVKRREP